jgi:chromosome partitioning protein
MIISFVNPKGGVGKTTVAVQVAAFLAGEDYKVLFVDTDPHGSVNDWLEKSPRKMFDVIHRFKDRLYLDIAVLCRNYDIAVVDTPPGSGNIILSALLASTFSVIPIEPSPYVGWNRTVISSLVNDAKKYNTALQTRLLISRKVSGTEIGRAARALADDYGFGVLDSEIGQRTDFARSLQEGLSVLAYAPKGRAATEVKKLGKELLQASRLLNGPAPYPKNTLSEIRTCIEEYRLQPKEKRSYPRQTPMIVADFVVDDRVYGGFIHNFSPGGVFVETRESFSLGQTITLTFMAPTDKANIKRNGMIVRITSEGIGVKFDGERVPSDQDQ